MSRRRNGGWVEKRGGSEKEESREWRRKRRGMEWRDVADVADGILRRFPKMDV